MEFNKKSGIEPNGNYYPIWVSMLCSQASWSNAQMKDWFSKKSFELKKLIEAYVIWKYGII